MATDTLTDDPQIATRGTLALLEIRLSRLEFLLSGASDEAGIPGSVSTPSHDKIKIWERLSTLESELNRLKKLDGLGGNVVRDIERLCRQTIGFA